MSCGPTAADIESAYDVEVVRATGATKAQSRVRRVAVPIIRRLWDLELVGFERLPADGPALLCPNHISFIDSVFVTMNAPRNVSSVGKAEYMDSWRTRYLFTWMGMIPIDRSGGSKAAAALEAAAAALRRGDLFLVYPEGTRSRNGKLGKGRTGAARLSLETGAPIYPVGITGTDLIQPPDARFPKLFRRARVEIGRPIRPDKYLDMPERHRALRAMTDEVMFEIRELTGQEYVNQYHGKTDDAGAEVQETAKPAHVTESLNGHEQPAPAELVTAAS